MVCRHQTKEWDLCEGKENTVEARLRGKAAQTGQGLCAPPEPWVVCDTSREKGVWGSVPGWWLPALDLAAAVDELPQCSIAATALWRPPKPPLVQEAAVGWAGSGEGEPTPQHPRFLLAPWAIPVVS